MLDYYINKIITELGIKNFSITHKAAIAGDFPLLLHQDIIIVHNVNICISVAQLIDPNITTIVKLESPVRRIEYNKNVFQVSLIDNVNVQLNSRIISYHNTRLDFTQAAGLNIMLGHIDYILIHNKDA